MTVVVIIANLLLYSVLGFALYGVGKLVERRKNKKDNKGDDKK